MKIKLSKSPNAKTPNHHKERNKMFPHPGVLLECGRTKTIVQSGRSQGGKPGVPPQVSRKK